MRRNLKLFKIFGLGAIPIIQLRESLIKDSKLTQSYLVLIVSSCLIATFGLILNSSAVIIGAMIIAPLMLPLRGLSFAALEGDLTLLRSSFTSIALGSIVAVCSSYLVGLAINLPSFGSEVASRTQPNMIDLLIALVAGGISGYAKIHPNLGDAIPGTAIAVALMPPLCVVGLTLSQAEWQLAQGATLLYLTNLIGISFACLIIYILGGYAGSNELSRNLSWGVSGFLIALLAVPLGISFWQLLGQTRVEDAIPKAISFALKRPDIKVIDSEVIWKTKPASVILRVQAIELVTPEDVAKLEQILREQLGQPFEVFVEVIPSRQVKSSTP
ncbi:MAG: DUF389 domain-containing protein [Prochloraceae cyanobacterium]